MKKVLFILLSCFLVLAACSNNNNDSKKSTSVDENKVQFTNDTLVLDQAVLKIKDTFLVNDKDLDNGKKLLAFKYEVKSKDGDEQITPMNVWIASMETTQDSENTESKLEVGPTPNTGKFEEWDKHNNDVIKKGKTAKGIITYELENDKQVTLKANKGTEGKKLGTKKINISKLKTVDYSAADDITNDSASSSKKVIKMLRITNQKAHLKMIMANHKTIMVIMNVRKVSKCKQHKVIISNPNNKTQTLLVTKNI